MDIETRDKLIVRGKDAWKRLKSDESWNSWVEVGEAIEIGRAEAMREAHTNKAQGRGYNDAMGDWLRANGFAGKDAEQEKRFQSIRAKLHRCMENLGAIETFRATLTVDARMALNHPSSVLKAWQASLPKADGEPAAKRPTVRDEVIRLQNEIDAAQAENRRLRQAASEGSLFEPTDKAEDIARVLIGKVGEGKLRKIAKLLIDAANAMSAPRKAKAPAAASRISA